MQILKFEEFAKHVPNPSCKPQGYRLLRPAHIMHLRMADITIGKEIVSALKILSPAIARRKNSAQYEARLG
jgi:hypothetical protein